MPCHSQTCNNIAALLFQRNISIDVSFTQKKTFSKILPAWQEVVRCFFLMAGVTLLFQLGFAVMPRVSSCFCSQQGSNQNQGGDSVVNGGSREWQEVSQCCQWKSVYHSWDTLINKCCPMALIYFSYIAIYLAVQINKETFVITFREYWQMFIELWLQSLKSHSTQNQTWF